MTRWPPSPILIDFVHRLLDGLIVADLRTAVDDNLDTDRELMRRYPEYVGSRNACQTYRCWLYVGHEGACVA
jgi:hypothetical protein